MIRALPARAVTQIFSGTPMLARTLMLFGSLLLVGLSGCGSANGDPMEAPGTWQPTAANDANLRAMLANPDDFYGGVGDRGSLATPASDAVYRLLTDKVKPLPLVSGVTFGGGSSAAAGGGATLGASSGGTSSAGGGGGGGAQ